MCEKPAITIYGENWKEGKFKIARKVIYSSTNDEHRKPIYSFR